MACSRASDCSPRARPELVVAKGTSRFSIFILTRAGRLRFSRSMSGFRHGSNSISGHGRADLSPGGGPLGGREMRRMTLLLWIVAMAAGSIDAFAQAGRRPVWMPGTIIAVDGSYVVTRNLAGGAAPAITITAPNVDLDLNGMTLFAGGAPVVISIPGPVSEVRIH